MLFPLCHLMYYLATNMKIGQCILAKLDFLQNTFLRDENFMVPSSKICHIEAVVIRRSVHKKENDAFSHLGSQEGT